MPYIPQEDREQFHPPVGMKAALPKTVGELNYVISMRIKQEYTEKGKSYALFNDIVADLEDAKEAIALGVRLTEFTGEIVDMAIKYILQTEDAVKGRDNITYGVVFRRLAALSGYGVEKLRKIYPTGWEIAKRTCSAKGAIECAKLEFVRRVVSPYEDQKILENGDVY